MPVTTQPKQSEAVGFLEEDGEGAAESLGLGDVEEVLICASHGGPQGDPFVIRLGGAAFERCLPLGRTPLGFVQRLQSLPGFDNAALIEALAVRRDAEVVCWSAGESGSRSAGGRFRR